MTPATIALTAALAALFAQPAPTVDELNLLPNGDFELAYGQMPAGWEPGAGASGAIHRWVEAPGAQAGKAVYLRLTRPEDRKWAWWKTQVSVEGGRRYRLAGRVKCKGARGQVVLGIHFLQDTRRLSIVHASPLRGTCDWTPVSGEFTAPPDADTAAIHCGMVGVGEAWFDDLRFGPSPAPWREGDVAAPKASARLLVPSPMPRLNPAPCQVVLDWPGPQAEAEIRFRLAGPASHEWRTMASLEPGRWHIPVFINVPALKAGSWRLSASVFVGGRRVCTAAASFAARPAAQQFKADLSAAQEALRRLRSLLDRAGRAGVETAYAQAAATIGELFLVYARWDARQPQTEALGIREATFLAHYLPRATEELHKAVDGQLSPPPVPRHDLSRLRVEGGHLTCGSQPVFLSSFNQTRPEDFQRARSLGATHAGGVIAPRAFLGWPDRAAEQLRQVMAAAEQAGLRVDVLLAHAMPEAEVAADRTLVAAQGHFIYYDIDHPAVRRLWQQTFEAAARAIGSPGALWSIDLANEPELPNGSQRTLAKFRQWLLRRYGSEQRLRQAWDEPELRLADITARPRGPADGRARWYDWCVFNQERTSQWFGMLAELARKAFPHALLHIKIANERTLTGTTTLAGRPQPVSGHSNGIDRQTLAALCDLNGCDTRILPDHPHYAINWVYQSMAFDLQRSIAPNKPIFDSEWHSIQTVYFEREELPARHIRAALWLGHVHGLDGTTLWWWSRVGPRLKARWGNCSLLTQPWLLDAYVRAVFDLRRLSEAVVALADAPRPVRLLYSETSAIQSQEYLDALRQAYQALYFFGPLPGFITERQLAAGRAPAGAVLVAPGVAYMTDAGLEGLARYSQRATVVVVGARPGQFDEHGRSRQAPRRLKRLVELPPLQAPRDLAEALWPLLGEAGILPALTAIGPDGKRCWGVEVRTGETRRGRRVAFIMNLLASQQRVRLGGRWAREAWADALTDEKVGLRLTLEPLRPYLLVSR